MTPDNLAFRTPWFRPLMRARHLLYRWIAGALLGLLSMTLALGCATSGKRALGSGASVCATLDSLYQQSGFAAGLETNGKATVDANQYRVRGKIALDIDVIGDVVCEFSSSILFGSQREDFVFSIVGDTIRILDRERGHYYEDIEAEHFLAEALGMDFDVQMAFRLAFGRHPPCSNMESVVLQSGSRGEIKCTGKVWGSPFLVVFSPRHRRLEEARWPIPRNNDVRDHLRVTYSWADEKGDQRLREIVMKLEDREWRCRISFSNS